MLLALTGRNYAFTELEKISDQNSAALRDSIRGYVRERMQGKKKSAVGNSSDILSQFLQHQEVFDEETIVDECVDFLVAGT